MKRIKLQTRIACMVMISICAMLPYASCHAAEQGYRVFNVKINVEWSTNKEKIASTSAAGTPVHENIGDAVIDVSLYFPPNGGEALKNLGSGRITSYENRGDPTPATISGEGIKNETISFFKPVWDGKNTLTISGLEYTVIPIDVTMHYQSPVKPVAFTDTCVWDKILGAFTASDAPGKIKEFRLDTTPGANNYFSNVGYSLYIANITFVVEDKGVLNN